MSYPNIALMGKAGSGKDTVGDFLVQRYGYTRLAFADPLKEMALSIDPIISAECDTRLSDIVGLAGWEYAKGAYPEVRRILQQVGQTIREYDPDYWLVALLNKAVAVRTPIVVTDVRYPNEYSSLCHAGFVPVRITRPDLTAVRAHESETALDDTTALYGLRNDQDIPALHGRVNELLDYLSR